jgi:hypothetical protein
MSNLINPDGVLGPQTHKGIEDIIGYFASAKETYTRCMSGVMEREWGTGPETPTSSGYENYIVKYYPGFGDYLREKGDAKNWKDITEKLNSIYEQEEPFENSKAKRASQKTNEMIKIAKKIDRKYF